MLGLSPVYKSRLAQYCYSLHRLSDKYLWRRVEIFVHPTFSVNRLYLTLQATVLHMGYIKRKTNTEFSCGNNLHQSRFKTTLSFLRQAGLLNNNTPPSNFELYILQLVPCVFTLLGCVLFWIHMFIDMIWRKLWWQCVGCLVCHPLRGRISVAGRPP